MRYTYLTEAERYDIYEQKKEGATLTEIAAMLRRSKSTISRELSRNSGERGYRPSVGIEHRCPRVEARATVSHWEGDTIIGQNHKYALVSLVERKIGFGLVCKVKTRHADGIVSAIIEALKPLKSLVRTITFDNGLAFAQHARITAETGSKVYLAAPYSSWQRGTNENWNGLVRQEYPQKSCFSGIKCKQLLASQHALNNRARKRLAWLTPR